MAQFSADSSPKAMPARFSPRAGNIGAQAAQKRPRGGGGGQKLGRAAPQPQQDQGQPQKVGRPQPQQQGDDPSQPQDLSYLQLSLQHFNMKGLGRDVPYIVWANRTGNYRQYAQPGRVPFDYFEDT
jgi:hypothetical protein